MNKKMNTLLFVLGATVFNILVTVAAFLLLLAFYARLLMPYVSGEAAQAWAVPLIFIAAIVISFVVYRVSLNFLLKKIDMDRYFDPLFVSRHRK
jgi:uncharacterized PurR-regulated membrane protein YhhQ (DUF165 family)